MATTTTPAPPFTGDDIYNFGTNLPPGPILFLMRYLDKIPIVSHSWRSYIPFGLATPPDGILSHHVPDIYFPKLRSLTDCINESNDIVNGTIDFLTGTNTVLGDLTTPTAIIVVLLIAYLIRAIKKDICLPFFCPIGKTLAAKVHGVKWCEQNTDRLYKFGEYCFRVIFHTSISLYGLSYFADKPWWDPARGGTWNLWVGHPHHPIEPGMIWYYLVEAAYNVEVLYYMLEFSLAIKWRPYPHLVWKDTARGDFREMMLHHFATIGLIYLSSYYRFTRVGSMVFLVHDVSDVPVNLSKCANFVKWQVTTIICFVVMVIFWFIARLCIYTFVIYRSMLFETQVLMKEWVPPEYFFAHRFLVIGLSSILVVLNIIWFSMFVKMGWILISKGKAHDLTEHKNGERDNSISNGHSKHSNGKTD